MLGDGEHVSNVFNTKGSMDDVGTRIKFLTELYSLWGTGIDILDKFDSHKPNYKDEKLRLVHARDLLWFHMTKDYVQEEDRRKIDAIDNFPKT